MQQSENVPSDLRKAMVDAHLYPLWESNNSLMRRKERPHVWRWTDVEPILKQVARITTPEVVERRVLHLVNPEARNEFEETAAGTITAAFQILMPGERARPHRHPMSALRFVVEGGSGAVTIVNGKSYEMAVGDLILTPGDAWHEHANNGSEPVIWADILDVATHLFLGTQNFEPGPAHDMPPMVDDTIFSVGGMVPDVKTGQLRSSPQKRYPAAEAQAALAAAPLAWDGVRRTRYANPLTGGSALEMLDLSLFELPGGDVSNLVRSNASSVCVVASGAGESVIDGEAIVWSRNDVFTIPRNTSVMHRGLADISIVFVVSDRALYNALGMLREECA